MKDRSQVCSIRCTQCALGVHFAHTRTLAVAVGFVETSSRKGFGVCAYSSFGGNEERVRWVRASHTSTCSMNVPSPASAFSFVRSTHVSTTQGTFCSFNKTLRLPPPVVTRLRQTSAHTRFYTVEHATQLHSFSRMILALGKDESAWC